jgi:hypothetical protein
VIPDSSAISAILLREPGFEALVAAITQTGHTVNIWDLQTSRTLPPRYMQAHPVPVWLTGNTTSPLNRYDRDELMRRALDWLGGSIPWDIYFPLLRREVALP